MMALMYDVMADGILPAGKCPWTLIYSLIVDPEGPYYDRVDLFQYIIVRYRPKIPSGLYLDSREVIRMIGLASELQLIYCLMRGIISSEILQLASIHVCRSLRNTDDVPLGDPGTELTRQLLVQSLPKNWTDIPDGALGDMSITMRTSGIIHCAPLP